MSKEAMNHAIDVLRDSQDYKMGRAMTVEAVEFLEEALAKQEQGEPVALETVYETIIHWDEGGGKRSRRELARRIEALYTTPQQRTWVGLTEDDEVLYPYPPAKPPVYATSKNTKSVRDGYELGGYEKEAGYYSKKQLDEFALTIEAKLKEKNSL